MQRLFEATTLSPWVWLSVGDEMVKSGSPASWVLLSLLVRQFIRWFIDTGVAWRVVAPVVVAWLGVSAVPAFAESSAPISIAMIEGMSGPFANAGAAVER